jgi:hypothetical protein
MTPFPTYPASSSSTASSILCPLQLRPTPSLPSPARHPLPSSACRLHPPLRCLLPPLACRFLPPPTQIRCRRLELDHGPWRSWRGSSSAWSAAISPSVALRAPLCTSSLLLPCSLHRAAICCRSSSHLLLPRSAGPPWRAQWGAGHPWRTKSSQASRSPATLRCALRHHRRSSHTTHRRSVSGSGQSEYELSTEKGEEPDGTDQNKQKESQMES